MSVLTFQSVTAVSEAVEKIPDRGMFDRSLAAVILQILLADVSNVTCLGILGEQMVEGLVLGRSRLLRDSFIPFLAIGKDRIDVEDHAAEIEQAMPNHVPDREPRISYWRGSGSFGVDSRIVGHRKHLGAGDGRGKPTRLRLLGKA